MSSRVRLARNFAGVPFVNRATRAQREQVLSMAQDAIVGAAGSRGGVRWIDLCAASPLERTVLVERHLISKQHAKGEEPRAVAVSAPDERLAVMVNEEDHLRLQVMRSGLDLSDAFAQIDAADSAIEHRAEYAYSPRFGYLTACPTNVGTGIRVSVMLHLPGLKLSGEIDKVKRAAQSMSLAVRGFYGEGSEALGDLFQISNQTTLGKSEKDILAEFELSIIPKVIEYERVERRKLLEKRRPFFEDQVFRALGLLRHARLLKSDEAMQLLSHVRMGVTAGVITDVDVKTVSRLLLLTQPGHLQQIAQREMDQPQRRVERAALVRRCLA
ncbi:MAG: protein arginine kinase [Phycisphaerales bacterium]|nr:protein arginine kinase [Phycisphaerales bacterium]